jgi:hypothetical protein
MTMPKDMDQAGRMLKMRIKIDVWSQGLDENFRAKIREDLRDLYCQLPARRVWYYLKHLRNMLLGGHEAHGMVESQPGPEDNIDGPEDVIVNGKYSPLDKPSIFIPLLTLSQQFI